MPPPRWRLGISYQAGVYEKYAHDAFDRAVGKPMVVTFEEHKFRGHLVSAVVRPDGSAVDLTFEVEGVRLP